MHLEIAASAQELGQRAALKTQEVLVKAVAERGHARAMLATGQSHFAFYDALRALSVPWEKIEIFHLDEYVGIPSTHPASFHRYLRERLINYIKPAAFYPIDGEADLPSMLAFLQSKLGEAPIDVGAIGIGENGHIAFNDPPADFTSTASYHVVTLDQACREQQVNEGWFADLSSVPSKAISATVHTILSCKVIVSNVPHAAKAHAVAQTLRSTYANPMVPATALLRHPAWYLYLDQESAGMLDETLVATSA